MSDSLRDRIAAVLLPSTEYCQQSMTRPCDDCIEHARKKADAVIAALGLREETTERFIYPDLPQGNEEPVKSRRYVTEWQPNDTPYCLRCGIPHTTPCRRQDNQ